jgi:hypothetical protein
MKTYYGVKSYAQIFNATHKVCNALGRGSNNQAPNLILETISAETQMGTFPDCTTKSGYGLCQFDPVGFYDVINRTRRSDKAKVKNKFGYDLNTVRLDQLNDDPVLSIILCRLKYKLRPEPIPNDIMSRAVYWKRFYNSSAGKGTVEHYLESAERNLYTKEL